MGRFRYHSSGSGGARRGQPSLDPEARRAIYGRVQPMDKPTLLEKLLQKLLRIF